MTRKPPLPTVQTYLICREIFQDRGTGEYILLGPISALTMPAFPSAFRVSIYIRLTGGHGSYKLGLQLRDQDDLEVGRVEGPEPLHHDDPLRPCQVCWQNLALHFPRPGRYHLALLFNDEQVAIYALDVILQARM